MIEGLPFREDVQALEKGIQRFLRFHEFKLKLDYDAYLQFDEYLLDQLEVYEAVNYEYSIDDVSKAYTLLTDLLIYECGTKELFKQKASELARYFLLMNFHVAVFWDKRKIQPIYEVPWEFMSFFYPEIWRVSYSERRSWTTSRTRDKRRIWYRGKDLLEHGISTLEVGIEVQPDWYYIKTEGISGYVELHTKDPLVSERWYDRATISRDTFDSEITLNSQKFRFLKDEALINMLFEQLKSNKLISKETELRRFQSLFDEAIPIMKVAWRDNDNILGYLIQKMSDKQIIDDKDKWEIAKANFLDRKGKPLSERIQQNVNDFMQRVSGGSIPKKAKPKLELIDSILRNTCELL